MLRARTLLWFAIPALFAALVSIGCSDGPASGPTGTSDTKAASTEKQGRAERVLPTTTAAADFVLALAAPERVVAVPRPYLEFAVDRSLAAKWTDDHLFTQFTAEVLLSRTPDLVVAGAWQSQDTVGWLRESGVNVVTLPTVRTLDDIREAIRIVGRALGAEVRAKEQLEDIDRRQAALTKSATGREQLTAMAYTNFGSGGWAAGRDTTADLMIQMTGMRNAAGGEGRQGHGTITIEELLELDPDVLIVSRPSDAYGASLTFLRSETALAQLACLRRGFVVELPVALFSSSSHHLLTAAESLASSVDELLKANSSGD